MKLPATPAETGEGKPATVKLVAAAGLTVMPALRAGGRALRGGDRLGACGLQRRSLKVRTPWSAAAVKV